MIEGAHAIIYSHDPRCHHPDVARILRAAAGYVARICMMRIRVMQIGIMQTRVSGVEIPGTSTVVRRHRPRWLSVPMSMSL